MLLFIYNNNNDLSIDLIGEKIRRRLMFQIKSEIEYGEKTKPGYEGFKHAGWMINTGKY